MVKIAASFIIGVYIGTYFDCKPHLKKIEEYVKENFPRPRE